MRKCNRKFAERFPRSADDRTNFPQHMAHSITNSKGFHLGANALVMRLLRRAGILPKTDAPA